MVDLDDAVRMVGGLPDVTTATRYGNRTWLVGDKGFAWQRPFSKADVRRFGDAPVPSGPILALRVADLRSKEHVLAERARGVFTIPHFDGYAAVLVQLDVVQTSVLKRLVTDAWLACAGAAGRPVSPRRRRRTRSRDGR